MQSKWLENHREANGTRRVLAKRYRKGCMFTNPIDACWRCQPDWEKKRRRLAKCALGFGKGTTGGKAGRKYLVTDPSDDDMVNPKRGTLRHAVIQTQPLWIVFARPMIIRLNQELIMTSHKTIDGRGAHVVIEGGAGITIQFVENIIIHGIKFRNIVPGPGGLIRDSAHHFGLRTPSDGDAISIFGSHHIWIDHCSFSKCYDGLIDVIKGSTAITISNCHMTHHDKVFLFGASDDHFEDRKMQITIAYTHFGKGLVQRMPRCRWGFFHIVNNDYTHWLMYAIGGGTNPTILSEGNRFIAPPDPRAKEVTHRQIPDSPWDSGTWISKGDMLVNGATFQQTPTALHLDAYHDKLAFPMAGKFAGRATKYAGPLKCTRLGC
ncbi:putative pectate lyase 7 [Bienertia sinuspersici]